MPSALLKAAFASVVTAGALLLPASAAQAAGQHHPCDGPGFGGGFGHRHVFGDRFGFDDDLAFDDDFDSDFDDVDFLPSGLQDWDDDDRPTVVVVNIKTKPNNHKPAVDDDADDAGDDAADDNGYTKPASNDGYGSKKHGKKHH